MAETLKKTFHFIKEHLTMLYSLALIILIPLAIFFNTYYITTNFQQNFDKVTRVKAALIEDVIGIVVGQAVDEPDKLQTTVERVMAESAEVVSFDVLRPTGRGEQFSVAASSKRELVGSEVGDVKYVLAWNRPEGIAMLDTDERGRIWNITKAIRSEAGEKIAILSLSFSIADSDQLVNQTISRSYFILVVTILIVMLMVMNQVRLFGYALTLSKLKEIDAMKDTFISMASHELRTPLTAIKGYIDLLSGKLAPSADADSRKYFQNIALATDRLNMLVGDMLEVSRLEGNRIPITLRAVDPGQLVSQAVEELRPTAMQKGLELRCTEAAVPRVKADPDRLKQILVNLIGNAIKYTPQGSVEVTLKEKNKELLITIADTGLGISAQDQAKLFQKFHRIQNDRTRSISGTGLGLWITSELVKKMGGTITVESIENVGSHFTVHLPVA